MQNTLDLTNEEKQEQEAILIINYDIAGEKRIFIEV